MADVGISYSHRDDAAAARVRQAFTSRGVSVWMDESGTDADLGAAGITLPWGQSHWEVITNEFAAADVIVVIDTSNWRESTYCQDEYKFVRHWGKWIEFIDPTEDSEEFDARIAAIAALLDGRGPVTGAHTRMVQLARTRGTGPAKSRLERLISREGERDALAVLTAEQSSSGLTITPEIAAVAAGVVAQANAVKRRLSQIATTAIAILAVLAIAGVAGMFFARAGERTAAAASARAQSLDFANRSLHESDTLKALSLAQQAGAADNTRTSADAISIATANDVRLRTLILGPEEYYGANLAAHAPILVGSTLEKLVVVDTDSGTRRRSIDVPDSIQLGTVAVSSDGNTAAFVTRGARFLHLVDLNTGQTIIDGEGSVSALTTGDGDDLWWSNDGGELVQSSFRDLAAGVPPTRHRLPAAALAVSVTPSRGLLDYVDLTGWLHSVTYGNEGLHEVDAFQLTAADKVAAPSRQAPALVKRCGENLFGAVAGSSRLFGTKFKRVDGLLETDRLPFGQLSAVVCNPDNTAWYSMLLRGGPEPFVEGTGHPILPTGSLRYLPAVDPSGTRTAVLTNDGKFYELRDGRIQSWPAPGARSVLPLTDAEYLIADNGDVIDTRTGSTTGTVGPAFLQRSVSSLARDALVAAAGATLVHIDALGATQPIGTFEGADYRSLRPGADCTQFVLTLRNRAMLFAASGQYNRTIPVKGLDSGESLVDSDISPDGQTLGFLTNTGRIGMITVDENPDTVLAPEFASVQVSAGTQARTSFVPANGGFAVFSTDGAVHLFDASLGVTNTAFYGVAPEAISAAGSWLVASSTSLGTTVYDGASLNAVDRVRPEQVKMVASTVRLDAARRELVGLQNYEGEDAEHSARIRVPLPGMR